MKEWWENEGLRLKDEEKKVVEDWLNWNKNKK